MFQHRAVRITRHFVSTDAVSRRSARYWRSLPTLRPWHNFPQWRERKLRSKISITISSKIISLFYVNYCFCLWEIFSFDAVLYFFRKLPSSCSFVFCITGSPDYYLTVQGSRLGRIIGALLYFILRWESDKNLLQVLSPNEKVQSSKINFFQSSIKTGDIWQPISKISCFYFQIFTVTDYKQNVLSIMR
jgi:hypothetical protein